MLRPATLSVVFSVILLSACASSERAALEQYISTGEEVGQTVSEAGSKFETLMNVVKDPENWSSAEKEELMTIISLMDSARQMADTMRAPSIIAEYHPLLIQSIDELRGAIVMMAEVANDPKASGTEEKFQQMNDVVESADAHITEYMDKAQAAIGEKYPDLIEGE